MSASDLDGLLHCGGDPLVQLAIGHFSTVTTVP
jgi:hypothetical protein